MTERADVILGSRQFRISPDNPWLVEWKFSGETEWQSYWLYESPLDAKISKNVLMELYDDRSNKRAS